ncbi:unnamed protein product [Ectocarpus fasciculatus]
MSGHHVDQTGVARRSTEDSVTHDRVPPEDSHTRQQQQGQQQLAVARCDEHDMGENNLLEEAGRARATAVSVGVNQRQQHEVDESVDPPSSTENAATELPDVPPNDFFPSNRQCADREEGFDAHTPTATARSRDSASSGIAQERRQQIELNVATTRGRGEGGGSRRHCMEPLPTALVAGSSDEKHAEQRWDTPALNGDSGSDVINDVSCVGRLNGGRLGSGSADSTGAFPREPGLSPEIQQPRAAGGLDCIQLRDKDSRREETPTVSLAPQPREAVSDLTSSSSSERRRVIQKQESSPLEGEQEEEEEEERVVVARLPRHAAERDVAQGKSSDGGNETERAGGAADSNRVEGLATAGISRKGGSGNNDDNDIGSSDGASFVKDDNLSGSEDEFGRGVAKHIGNQRQKRREERHRPSQSPNEEQSGGRSGSTGSSGSRGSGKGTDDTPPRAPFVRPRRLSMEDDSELQRTLAKELMGMSRTSADHPVGEEEAEREEEHRQTLLNMTPGVLASLFNDDDDDGDGEWFQRNADPPRPSTTDDGDAGATDTGVNKRHRRSLSSHSEGRGPSSSRRRRGSDEADVATVSTQNDVANDADADEDDDSTNTEVSPTPKRKPSATLRAETSNPCPRRSSQDSDKGDLEPPSRLRKSSASRLSRGKQRNGGTTLGDTAAAPGDTRSGIDGDGGGENAEGTGGGEREGTAVAESGAEGEAEETGAEQRRDSGASLSRRPKGPGPIVMNASHCEYAVVRECALELGWNLCETKFSRHSDPLTKKPRTDEANPNKTADASYTCTHKGMCNKLWNVMWHDHGNFEEHLQGLQSFQYYSHLPGLSFFARKAGLAMLMSRMYHEAPKEYKFFPETWVLPAEMNEFREEFGPKGTSKSIFIIKPDAGCQGKGIFLTKQLSSIAALQGKSVAQRYLTNPLLIDGYKFDLRLYVLVTSVNPMRIFLFEDGLVRICTEAYEAPTESNITKTTMHLTNYSVNKASSNFTSDDMGESGFKRSVKWFKKWLDEQGHDSAALWARLADACVKTFLTVGPMLRREYNAANPPPGGFGSAAASKGKAATPTPPPPRSTCFTIVGVDLMVDEELDPWIIEINHLPSFRTETGMDYRIKKQLVFNTLSLLDVRAGEREEWQTEMERLKRIRLFGLPPKDGGQSPASGPGGGGEAGRGGGSNSPKNSSKKKNRSRHDMGVLAVGRAREEFEQAVKGGFERIFPPSETSPDPRASYTKVLRVAEKVFASLSKYSQSPVHSPRSASPPPSPSRGNRPGSAQPRSSLVSPKSSPEQSVQHSASPRASLVTQPPPLSGETADHSEGRGEGRNGRKSSGVLPGAIPPPVVIDTTATPGTEREARIEAGSTAPVAGAAEEARREGGDGKDSLPPARTDSGSGGDGGSRGGGDLPEGRKQRRVEFKEGDTSDHGSGGFASGDATSPSPASRRRRSSGRGSRNKKGSNKNKKSPSRSPARRRGRGRGAGGRDWEKEAKRRKKLYKKAARLSAEAAAAVEGEATENSGIDGEGGENNGGHLGSEETGIPPVGFDERWGGRQDGRESMVDLEGPHQDLHQHMHMQMQMQQSQQWSATDNLDFQQSSVFTRSTGWPTPGYRGMGSIVRTNNNSSGNGGNAGVVGGFPAGCGLRPVVDHRPPGHQPTAGYHPYAAAHHQHGQQYHPQPVPSSPPPLASRGDCWPTRAPFRPSTAGSIHGGCGTAATKPPPFRFSRSKIGDPVARASAGFDGHGGVGGGDGGYRRVANGCASGGAAMSPRRPNSAARYTGATRRAIEVPAAHPVRMPPPAAAGTAAALPPLPLRCQQESAAAVAGVGVIIADGRRTDLASFLGDGGREHGFDADRRRIIDYGGGGGGGNRPLQRPQTSTGSRTACQNIVNLLPPASPAKTVGVNGKPLSASGTRPASSPRRPATGRGRGRGGGAVATELIMPTVSLYLGSYDEECGAAAVTSPEGYRAFTGGSARNSPRVRQVSPSSLLADAATVPTTLARKGLSDRPLSTRSRGSYGGNGGGGFSRGSGGGSGGDDDCIRPAEAVPAGVEKKSARSHGFRRWRPGECEVGIR